MRNLTVQDSKGRAFVALFGLMALIAMLTGCPGVPPSVTLSSGITSPTSESLIPVSVSFSKTVTGFQANDIRIAGGSMANFSGNGSYYSFTLIPAGEGIVTADIDANVCKDWSGLLNTQARQFVRSFDATGPAVEMLSDTPQLTNSSPIPVVVKFSEVVSGFSAASIEASNASVVSFSGSGSQYSFGLLASADGEVSATINAGEITDMAGNPNGSSQFTRNFDETPPTVTLTSNVPETVTVSPITVTATFSESVSGFTIADVITENCTVDNFQGSDALYTFDVYPISDGIFSVTISDAVAQDAAGNEQKTPPVFSRAFSTRRPTVTMTSAAPNPTSTSPITVAVNFSEAVTGFDRSDIIASNAAVGAFTGSGSSYYFNLLLTADGTVTADIPADIAQNGAGNTNVAAAQFSRVYNTTRPTVTLSSSVTSPTNVSSIPVVVSFSEPVTGFGITDITTVNASVTGFVGSGASYSFSLIPHADGTVAASIAADAAVNSAGSGNVAAAQLTRTYTTVRPTAGMNTTIGNPTNAATIPVTVSFSADVTGFTAGDIAVANASVSSFSGNGASYSFNLIPSADGTVSATIAADVAYTLAGNGNQAAAPLTRTYSTHRPSVTLNTTIGNPTNATTIPITVVFDEAVTGFTASDVNVTNASISSFAGSGANYSFNVAPAADGAVTVNVPENVAYTTAGNGNKAATPLSRTYDTSRPTITLSSTAPSLTNTAPIPVTVAFSQDVTGFTASDVNVSNGTLGAFTGSGASYTFSVTPAADGTVTVNVPENAATTSAGNGNKAATALSRTYDTSRPTTTLSSTVPSATNIAPIPVLVAFSQAVTGFAASDVSVTNGTVSAFTGSGASYSFSVAPAADGVVSVRVPEGVATTEAGNTNKAATQVSCTYDCTHPSVAMTSSVGNPTTQSPIPVAVTFDEAVTGFDASDIAVSNAALTGFAGSGTNYSFNLVPSSAGTVTANIPAGAASDATGNPSAQAPQFATTFTVAEDLTVSMSTTLASPTSAFPIPVQVSFNQPVTGFASNDLVVSNATVGTFTGSGADYTFELVPNQDGAITADIAADSAFNAGGTGNQVAPQFTITFASEPAPTAVIEIHEESWLSGTAVSATQSYAPMAVFFEGWQSAPREEIAEYEWNYGDGSPLFNGFNGAHVYETPGTYTASLTVTNEYGWSDVATVIIDVLARDGMTYYVDAELGNDGNAGTSPEQAWRTAAFAFNGSYQAGDQILFKRGQTFLLQGGAVSSSSWYNTQGYKFGTYGEGVKPLIQLSGTSSSYLFPNPRYFAYVTFEDLRFNMTSAEGATNTLAQMTNQMQNITFLGCDVENCHSAFLMQSSVTGFFLVDTTVTNSVSMQLYSTGSRIAMIDSVFDLSANHIAYLEVINKGVITGSTFSRSTFGRHAFRLSGRVDPTTNNVVISNNTFRGWIEPGETRYNWMLVHLAPNVPELQFMKDVLFQDNTLEDAETLLNIGNYENIVVRRNYFSTPDTYAGGRRVLIGSKHGFDTMPVKNCHITENTFLMQATSEGATSIFSILAYPAAPYEGRSVHEDIRIDKNVIAMVGGDSRVLWFEADNAAQRAEVTTDNTFVYNSTASSGLFQVGGGFYSGAVYTLAQWQSMTGDDASSQLCSFPQPVSGWADAAPSTYTAPIAVNYTGAFSTGGSGLDHVNLWVSKNGGTWQDTGIDNTGNEAGGTFQYSDPQPTGAATYRFAVQAEDTAGNKAPAPTGNGHCQVLFGG